MSLLIFFSRNFKDDIEWCLNREVFLEICNRFGEPDLDLFASRLNRQTLNFVSWFPDPEALMTDAFSFSWAPFFLYGFPPFCLLNKLLAKIRSDSARGIFILPVWPTQPWFPAMLHLLAANPVMLLQSENLLFLPFSNKKHRLLPQMRLMACLLSGCRLETRNSSTNSQNYHCFLERLFQETVFGVDPTMGSVLCYSENTSL